MEWTRSGAGLTWLSPVRMASYHEVASVIPALYSNNRGIRDVGTHVELHSRIGQSYDASCIRTDDQNGS